MEKELKYTIIVIAFLVITFLAIKIPTPPPTLPTLGIAFLIFMGLVLFLPNLIVWAREVQGGNINEEIQETS